MPLRALLFAIAAASTMTVAQPGAAHPIVDLASYCKQLVVFYDRYGAGRSETSDGRRNHTRIAADLDCKSANHEEGVDAMSTLLQQKRFRLPAPSGEVSSSGE